MTGQAAKTDPARPKHWYTEHDPDLPTDPQPVWRLVFDLALAVARVVQR
ncbi:MAG: hypothetical protein ACRDF0_09655 [Candidatus Limnocylindria bacterium]